MCFQTMQIFLIASFVALNSCHLPDKNVLTQFAKMLCELNHEKYSCTKIIMQESIEHLHTKLESEKKNTVKHVYRIYENA